MTKTPNFLFIVTDQHRADHLGCYGNTVVKTPNIDSLAARGTRFDRFYVANPICMCNRASILTSRMPSLHGGRHNGIPLSLDHTTFVELLRNKGYDTALIGKSHLQGMTGLPATAKRQHKPGLELASEELREAVKRQRIGEAYDQESALRWQRDPTHRVRTPFYGFDEVKIADDHADLVTGDYAVWLKNNHPELEALRGPEGAIDDDRYCAPQAWRTQIPEEHYPTAWIANECQDFLKARTKEDDPFFLMMSFPDPHHPFTPPGKYWDMYDPDEIELPASFGKGDIPPIRNLRRQLAEAPEARVGQDPFAVTEREAREIIALTYGSITMIDDAVGRVLRTLEEQGLAEDTIVVFTSDHGDYMGDHGLMLKLLMHYQGLIRVPFIWADPRSPEAKADSALRSAIDIGPTFLERAGIQPFTGCQGSTVLEPVDRQGLIVEEDSQRVMAAFERPQRIRTYVEKDWRITLRHGEDWNEMYDLKNDPDEVTNLWDHPDHAAEQARLVQNMVVEMINLQDRAPLPTCRA
ncbi:sulfatase family protein [Paracoccus homiensis]|uniref:Arylsulfatase A n=1 Tax=Paracoccus homiensis TaxID=364199 RepID=A0A1I0ISR8_9RHOB|nr:sulfatase-like hydrolase/transferase [Paracoccus homiensis]SET99505.1 Arylsulfatase A [Paracoccus homiensis]